MLVNVSAAAGHQDYSDDNLPTYKQLHCNNTNKWHWAKDQVLHWILLTTRHGVILWVITV